MGKIIFTLAFLIAAPFSFAAPAIDTLNVQGLMKIPGGAPVADGSYQMAFGVFQNGAVLWAGKFPVTTAGGLFAQALSGTGANLSALPASTGMNADFSGVALNPALLSAGGAGEVMIRVYALDAINGANPQFDIVLGAVPTAFVADTAKQVNDGTITLLKLAAAAKTNVSGGAADAGKLPLLNASGLLDASFVPNIPASQINSGQVGVANGGTGSNNGSITGSGSVVYQSGSGATTTIGNSSGAAVLVLQSGTGGISQTVAGTTGNISFSAGSTSGSIVLTPGSTTGAVTIGNAGSSGSTSLGNSGGGSATAIFSGTGGILLSPAGTGIVRVTNGNGLNLVHGTGSVTLNAPLNPTSYVFNLPASAGGAGQMLATDGTGNTSWSGVNLSQVTGTLAVANGGTGAVTAVAAFNALSPLTTKGDLLYGDGANSSVRLPGNTTTAKLFLTQTGDGSASAAPVWGAIAASDLPPLSTLGVAASGNNTDISGLAFPGALTIGGPSTTVQFAASGFQLINGSGNVQIQAPLNPTSWTMILPSTSGSANQFLITNGFGTTSWATPNLASSFSGILPIANGGTGAATPTAARTALGAAASGANTDITSLSGLTTALSILQGGTGATTASAAFNALSPLTTLGDLLFASGPNTSARLPGNTSAAKKFLSQQGDGTSSAAPVWAGLTSADLPATDLTTATGTLAIVSGGTGATSAAGALASLGAASRGANGDITSLTNLSTPLPVNEGGTGAASAAAALSALGAAASGANTDITSLSPTTGKIKIQSNGSTGVAFSSLGACAIASFHANGNAQAQTCTGLPANSVVHCSPTGSPGNETWSSWASAAGQVTIITSKSISGSMAWNCMWMLP